MSTSLEDVAKLVNALIDADEKVEDAENHLKYAKEHARVLREETIPSVMHELGINEIKLDTGKQVTIKQEVYTQLSEENKPNAFQWLKDNNFDGLIKTQVSVAYGRGEFEKAEKLQQYFISKGVAAILKQEVHCKTLQAFVKEQLAGGKNIPLDLFGARPVWTTKIK